MLSRTGDVGGDPRCPVGATDSAAREKGVGTARGPAAEKDWTESECGQRCVVCDGNVVGAWWMNVEAFRRWACVFGCLWKV